MLRSASIIETVVFYVLCGYGIDVDADFFKYEALQIPTGYTGVLYLNTERIINYAHRHNIAVQYWTINEAEEMARLQSIGADAIMTDVPDVGAKILKQP